MVRAKVIGKSPIGFPVGCFTDPLKGSHPHFNYHPPMTATHARFANDIIKALESKLCSEATDLKPPQHLPLFDYMPAAGEP
jgi:hypothetical protein